MDWELVVQLSLLGAAAAAALLFATIANGWALSILWAWFVVPTFSLPSLSVPAAMGIVLTAQLIYRTDPSTEKYKDMGGWELAVTIGAAALAAPAAAVGFGWLVRQFL